MALSPQQERNQKLGKRMVTALNSRQFEAYYCDTREEAVEKALALIPQGDTVFWGGSQTIREIGLTQKVKDAGYTAFDRDQIPAEQWGAFYREHYFADTYLTSVNAISEDGQLCLIDKTGNRAAALIFGPKNVIVVVGLNKVARTAEDAMRRVRYTAAPINCQRFVKNNTPCRISGECGDCVTADSICASLVTLRTSGIKHRIKVILVGEVLGF